MDEVEVKVVQLEVLEGELAGREDVLVVCVPESEIMLYTHCVRTIVIMQVTFGERSRACV